MRIQLIARWMMCVFFLFTTPLNGDDSLFFKVGAEIYKMRRWRPHGTVQSGRMDGVRVELERFKGNSWYVGFDGLLATGKLNGHNSSGMPLHSTITDYIYEGRIGYTLQNCTPRYPFFTIFGGYGHFHEINDFHIPSPLTYTFHDTFNYVTVGFLSGVNFTPLLSMGVNFKGRFMLNGKSVVSDDPLFDHVSLVMNNETHYRLEIPFTYLLCNSSNQLDIILVPFYEFRHFGGREGFPFDYIDTKFSLLGARVSVAYRF